MKKERSRFVVRTTKSIKKDFKRIAKKLGVSMSKLLNIYISSVIEEDGKTAP